MRTPPAALLLVAFVALTVSCGGRTTAPPRWPPSIQPLGTPAGTASSEPQLTSSSRGVLLSWLEHAGPTVTLKFAERTTSGWTRPTTVASGDDWFVSYADPPAVLRLSDGTLVAQWLQQTDPRLEAMDLRLSYSRDDGRSWARPFTPHHDGTRTQHAFASLFELPDRALGLVWLDGRESLIETEDPAGGSMTMRYAAYDAAWTQTADAAIDHRVCECCSTAVATTADGAITAYRDRSAGEIRDISVSRLEGATWSAGIPVHHDNWKTYSCPVNGPALTARGRDTAVAWFTAVNDEGHAHAAFSSDAGRTWGAPIRLDDATALGRVDIEMLDDGSAVATWIEFAGGRAQLRMRRVEASGARSAPLSIAGVAEGTTSGIPRLARMGNELVFAWTQSGTPAADGSTPQTVRTAVAAMTPE
jgi:hypothetical protein